VLNIVSQTLRITSNSIVLIELFNVKAMFKVVELLRFDWSEMILSKLGDVIGRMMTRVKKAEKTEMEKEKAVSEVPSGKVYLKALPLRALEDVDVIKQEVKSGNILILKVSPLARKSIDDVKRVVNELLEFTESVGGDIARLGEERVVVTPSFVRIWREKVAGAPTASMGA